MTDDLDRRIIACGREAITIAAIGSDHMNNIARTNRLLSEFRRIARMLCERGFFGSISFSYSPTDPFTRASLAFDLAVKAYLRRRGGLEALLLKYDAIMAEGTPPPVATRLDPGLPLFDSVS